MEEIELQIKQETDKAWYVTDGDINVWLPKSQVDVEVHAEIGRTVMFLVPQWLLEEKGLC